jgi:hypothetical protein
MRSGLVVACSSTCNPHEQNRQSADDEDYASGSSTPSRPGPHYAQPRADRGRDLLSLKSDAHDDEDNCEYEKVRSHRIVLSIRSLSAAVPRHRRTPVCVICPNSLYTNSTSLTTLPLPTVALFQLVSFVSPRAP